MLSIFLWSRAAIWVVALLALHLFVPNRHPDADRWDSPRLHELGAGIDVWARWDSDWYLLIAEEGYAGAPSSTPAFFPLYPALVALVGRALAGHYVLAGVLVSLAACLAAFALLHRLALPRLGEEGARRAVLYLALFPTALFLQAVYSESLFLALALATFLLAERGRFLGAGAAAGLALLTRPAGLALLPALALLAWRAERRARALASVALAASVGALYPLLLAVWIGEPLAFLVLAAVAWRAFGAAYGLFAAAGLALPLSVPSERWPLLSLPRFGLVLFPLVLALALLGGRRRGAHEAILAVSSLLLGLFVVQWALWQWVA